MGNLRRRLMLVSLIMLCVMPQGFIQAAPLQTDVNVDLSWIKELPTLMALVIIMFLVLVFVLRYLNSQQKVSVPTADGGSKNVHVNEYVGSTMKDVLEFLRESKAKDRVFMEAITDGLRTSNGAVVQALDGLKEALVQGNGNQITAMMEVRDEFRGGVTQMQNHRTSLQEALGQLQTRVGSVQAEGAKMDKELETLIGKISDLALALNSVLDRLAKVEKVTADNVASTLDLKNDVDELRSLTDHFASLMSDLTAAIQQHLAKPILLPPVPLNPPGPVAPETTEEKSNESAST